MRILASNPDTIGDMILRQRLYEAILADGHELTLVVRQSVAPVVPHVAPGAGTLILSAEPYRDDIAGHWDDFTPVFDAARALRPDVLLVAPYRWTQFDERLADELRGVPGLRRVGMSGRLYAGDPWAGRPPASRLTFDVTAAVDEATPEAEKNAALAEALLGHPPAGVDPRIGAGEASLASARAALAQLGLEPGGYWLACVTGTMNVPIKVWPAEPWGRVLGDWAARRGRRFLLVGLPPERPVAEDVLRHMGDRAADNARIWMPPGGDFDQLVGLASLATGYVGHDTGPMHLAAAVGRPVLAVFGGGTWPRFLPRVTPSVAVTVGVPCVGCGWSCTFSTSHCIKQVPADEVTRAADDLEEGRVTGREARVLEPSRELQARMIAEVSQFARERTRDAGDAGARAGQAERSVVELRDAVARLDADAAALKRQAQEQQASATELRARLEAARREADAAQEQAAALQERVARLESEAAAAAARQEGLRPRRPRRPLRQVAADLVTGRRDYVPWREPRPLPKLTLVTPVRAFDARAIATIESVLATDYPHLEYVVVDATPQDGSAGATAALPAELRERIARVGRVAREKDPAPFAGVKAAFDASRADVLGWLEPGRVLEPGALLRVGEAFAATPRSPVIYFDDTRAQRGWRTPPSPSPRLGVYALLACDGPPPISVFFRRHEYTLLAPIDPARGAAAGWDLTVRYARRYGLTRAAGHVACRVDAEVSGPDAERADFAEARRRFTESFGRPGRIRCRAIQGSAGIAHGLRRLTRRDRLTAEAAPQPHAGAMTSFTELVNPVTGRAPDRLLLTTRDPAARPDDEAGAATVYYDTAGDTAIIAHAAPAPPAAAGAASAPTADAIERARTLLAAHLGPARTDAAVMIAGSGAAGAAGALQAGTAWRVIAVDPAGPGTSAGLDVYACAPDDAFMNVPDGRTFDAMVLFGVERLADPLAALRRLRLLLAPAGLLVLRTPNLDSAMLDRFGAAWSRWEVAANRTLFGRRGVRLLAEAADFELLSLQTQTDAAAVARSLQLQAAGLSSAVPPNDSPDAETARRAARTAEWARKLHDWRGRGDELWVVLRSA